MTATRPHATFWNASAGTASSAVVVPINVLVSAVLSLICAVTGAVAVQPKRAMQEAAYVSSPVVVTTAHRCETAKRAVIHDHG